MKKTLLLVLMLLAATVHASEKADNQTHTTDSTHANLKVGANGRTTRSDVLPVWQ